MRWVECAAVRPHHCAVLPFVGNSSTTKGFIDTGSELDGFDNHVYVSVEAVEEMARMCGWFPPGVVADLEEKLRKAEATAGGLADRLQEAERFREAAEYTLGQFGSKVRAKPGRKPEKVVS